MPSVLHNCLQAILTNLTALQEAGTFREVAIRPTIEFQSRTTPSCLVIPGGEVLEAEDTRGFSLDRELAVKITFGDFRAPWTTAATLVAAVQRTLEGDLQLDGLTAPGLIYRGEEPFITEATAPLCGVILTYGLRYRRLRGDPDTAY